MMKTVPILYPVILAVPDAERQLKGRDKVRALSRLARIALRYSCQKSGLHLAHFPKSAEGIPLPLNGIHWSLSHKSTVVGGVAAPFPVGFDLETIRPVNEGLMAKVAGEAEWHLTREDRRTAFFRFWTAKEAVLKAVGQGIAGLSRCRVVEITDETRMTLVFDEIRWPVVHFRFDHHVAAITPQEAEVCWTLMSLPSPLYPSREV
jgi:4'-phosphopantetheinyl transferase